MGLRDFAKLATIIAPFVSPAVMAQVDTWAMKAPIPTSRVFHATCAVAGQIYVFGGQRMGGGAGITSVEAYDPATDSWSARADMPTARLGMTAGVVNDKCYVIGGASAPGGAGLSRIDE
ncbi:MAG: hypothetical protein GTN86_00165, partial [Xanthomonadales bacterium]|uniref:kelch repeat-containing protein n=1 Tax=Hydrogenophaga sp. TaxID=1904254 RepID=UPI00169D7DDA